MAAEIRVHRMSRDGKLGTLNGYAIHLLLKALAWATRQMITFTFLAFALLGAAAIAKHQPHLLDDTFGWLIQSTMFLWWAIQRMLKDQETPWTPSTLPNSSAD